MIRVLVWLHRYVGIAICLLMACWCLSGMVMMYVPFPSFVGTERLATLSPLRFDGCCRLDAARSALSAARVETVSGFRLEMLAGRPVLRLATGRSEQVVELTTGTLLENFDVDAARQIATEYAHNVKLVSAPRLAAQLDADQWTVSGGYRRDQPLYRFALADRDGTEIYVSSTRGEVVQRTTARQRFWNFGGAVLHWLYFTPLRTQGTLWSRVVIGVSLAGVFLTFTGLWLGVQRLRWSGAQRLSPYRGLNLWHHVLGLSFGLLTLTWVGSGLLSMNPWGWLESDYRGGWQTDSLSLDQVLAATHQAAEQLASADASELAQIAAAPLNGRLFLLLKTRATDGPIRRMDALAWQDAPLGREELAEAVARRLPAASSPLLLTAGDDYYYSDHDQGFEPAYRVIDADAGHSRYYFDAISGALLTQFDPAARGFRWAFDALHRWDLPGVRRRPLWDALMIALLSGVTALCVTGVVLGFRRVSTVR
jgi:uncharacterized iron-regulated membrane protein